MALSLAVTATSNQRLLTQAIEAMFAAQPGHTILTNLTTSADATSAADVADLLVAFAENTDTAADFAAAVVANLGITVDTVGDQTAVDTAVAFVEGQLNAAGTANWGSAVLDTAVLYAGLTDDATYGAAATAFNAAVTASLDYSLDPDNTDILVPTPDSVTVFNLTTAADNITGTVGNDQFTGYIQDNQNTAQSGDIINGGSGTDSLFVDIGNSQDFAITLHTNSVENFAVRAEARAEGNDTNDNNMTDAVQIDAERMEGTVRYETNNSRADVIIEDVRIEREVAYGDDTNEITRDVTVAMVSTDPGDVDLGVYFDQHSLVKQGDIKSAAIVLTVGNQVETPDFDAANPLKDIPYTNVAFLVDDQEVILTLDLTAVTTYDEMWDAISAAFTAEQSTNPLLENVTITRSELTDTFFSKDGVLRTADEYTLSITDGTIDAADTGWFAEGGLPSNNAFSATVEPGDESSTSSLITSTIILDDVGRGSMGGDLVVGGLSTGDTSDSLGVEQFDITVERSSELQEIQSTNNTLREVYIVNGDTNGNLVVAGDTNGDNDIPGVEGNAGLTDVRVVDASAMVGSVSIDAELTGAVVGKYMDLVDTAANVNADDAGFIYSLGGGADSLDLVISNENLRAAGTTAREDFFLDISGGASADALTVIIGDGTGNDGTPWYNNSKIEANLTVSGGTGDDTITTTGTGDFNINGEDGNDTIYTDNSGLKGTWVVNATAASAALEAANIASDVATAALITAENATPTVTVAATVAAAVIAAKVITAASTQTAAEIVAMDAALDLAALQTGATQASIYATLLTAIESVAATGDSLITDADTITGTANSLLVGSTLTVTYAGAAANSVISGVAAAGTEGYESTVDIPTVDSMGNELSVVQAIKAAINGDAVLSKILSATDGTGGTLNIDALIDGVNAATDLEFTITAPTAAANPLTAAELTAAKVEWNDMLNTSGAVITDAAMYGQIAVAAAATLAAIGGANGAIVQHIGNESTSTSDNIVAMGAGDDVVVLGTNDVLLQSNDTLVWSGYNQGDDTIVNYLEGAGTNLDTLDFSAYLGIDSGNNVTSISGSVDSQVLMGQTFGAAVAITAADTIVANEIVIQTGLAFTAAQTTAGQSWANMTAADYSSAINNAATVAYGNIAATIDASAPDVADLVADKTSIVFVENAANTGEYKLFELTSTNASDLEFTEVQLIGTVDFGDSITNASVII